MTRFCEVVYWYSGPPTFPRGVLVHVRREGSLFQQVQDLSRQRSSQPGSYLSGPGGNEGVEA